MSQNEEVTYVCSKCKAEDHDRGHGPRPQVLNCWNCAAGRGVEIPKMLASGIGMYQKRDQK